jgi:type I restriction enzyme M protein
MRMVNGFSQNVRDIFEKFGFLATVDKLAEKNRLYLVVIRNFAETDLRDKDEDGKTVVTNHDMGQAFEELLRKFNDVSPAGEQYTPRDVIELMVTILFGGMKRSCQCPASCAPCTTQRRAPAAS